MVSLDNIFGLLPYMDSYRRSLTSDRGSNILNALKGELFKAPPKTDHFGKNTKIEFLL